MASKIFAEMLAQIDPEDNQFVEKNLAISYQVRAILDTHPTIRTQKALAEAMGKEPSEISKWLSGLHNIGLENITKMETVLGQDIILTVEQAKERFAGAGQNDYQSFQEINFAGKAGQSEKADESVKKRQILSGPVQQEKKEIVELAY